jgi:hypothetical protein
VAECQDEMEKGNNGLYKGSSRCKDGSEKVIERTLDSRMMLGHVRKIFILHDATWIKYDGPHRSRQLTSLLQREHHTKRTDNLDKRGNKVYDRTSPLSNGDLK